MNDIDRKRLVSLLGMLGSNSAGERDNAATQAERLRCRLGKSWEELLADRVIYSDCFIPPWPAPRHEVRRPKILEVFPLWWLIFWCLVAGFIAGTWVTAACH